MEDEKRKEKIVLLFSGGYDSTVLLFMALNMKLDVHCVLINYNQVHAIELEKAQRFLEKDGAIDGVDYQVINIKGLDLDSTLLNGVKAKMVPGRNLMFLSIASAIAENLGVKRIWIGANFSDYLNKFPDCYQSWIGALQEFFQSHYYPIKIEAPLLGMSKETIVELGKNLYHLNMEDVHSGYSEK